MKKVLYVLLPQFAEHEMPYLTQPLRSDSFAMKEHPEYENRIVAETMEPVEAISGFRLLPDYTFDSIPDDYAALVLIGDYGWKSEAAERIAPIVADAIRKGRIVGAICNAASWMASRGFLTMSAIRAMASSSCSCGVGRHTPTPQAMSTSRPSATRILLRQMAAPALSSHARYSVCSRTTIRMR